MKPETYIIEGNKLIAEFRGMKKSNLYLNLKSGNYVKKENDDCESFTTSLYIINGKGILDLKFHSSWDWLMPVIEQIENTESYITTKETMKNIRLSIPDINLVYHFVVEFIKWYNENKIS